MSEYRNRSLSPLEDRMTCRACGFKGVPIDLRPARDAEPVVVQTGTTWMVPLQPRPPTVAEWQEIDFQTSVTPQAGTCAFCGTNMPWNARIEWGR